MPVSATTAATPAPGAAGGTVRLFFALLPDSAARAILAVRAQDVARETGGRATGAGNLHVTLAFLGNVAQSRIAQVEAVGARAAAIGEPFALRLERFGWFRNAGAAWIGPATVAPALQQIVDALCIALREAGFASEERAFHPHLTLARRCVRGPAAAAATVGWRADAMALMASDTLPGGVVYRVLASWPLGVRAGTLPSR